MWSQKDPETVNWCRPNCSRDTKLPIHFQSNFGSRQSGRKTRRHHAPARPRSTGIQCCASSNDSVAEWRQFSFVLTHFLMPARERTWQSMIQSKTRQLEQKKFPHIFHSNFLDQRILLLLLSSSMLLHHNTKPHNSTPDHRNPKYWAILMTNFE